MQQPRNLNLSSKQRALFQKLLGDDAPPAAAGETGPAPLSFAQERLWFLDRFQPGMSVYNMPFSINLPDPLRVNAVEQALAEIVRRHEVLRTTFPIVDGRPVQRVAGEAPLKVPLADLRAIPEGMRQQSLQRLFMQEWEHVFELAGGPLFRARIVQLEERSHVLLVNMHHIVSDGWSLGLFMREFSLLYEAFAAGRPSPLPPLPLTYSDYAREQRQRFTAAALDTHLQYWRRQLAAIPPALALPSDRPRPAQQTFRGETQFFFIAAPVAAALASLGRRSGTTLFMVLLAVWKTLLYRYTGEAHIVVGTPIANRNRTEHEQLIGFFVNTLVLHTELDDSLTFNELLARVREVTLGAYAHQDMPFEKLVEELRPERHLNYNPLFQVLFALQNTPPAGREPLYASAQADPGVAPIVMASAAKFDLSMFLGETSLGLAGELEYSADLFDTATATRMIGHFLTLATAAAEDPDRRLADLPLLSTAEREQILYGFNAAQVDPGDADERVHHLFDAQAERTPLEIAVEHNGIALSYAELARRSNGLARRLRALGAGCNGPVAIALGRCPDAMIAVLAALKAGAAYVPLDIEYPHSRLRFMIDDARARVLVTHLHLADRFASPEVAVVALDEPGALAADEDDGPCHSVDPADLAYMIYTSGSTGRPKGVAMPHRPLVDLIRWHVRDPELGQPRRTLQFAPLSFDVSFQEMMTTWCSGGTLVLVDEETRRDPHALLGHIVDARIERLFLPPIMLEQLAEAAMADAALPASLREIITAGEQLKLSPPVVALLARLERCALRNHYGPTETHVVTEHVLSGAPHGWPALPPIGCPIANARVYLLDVHMQLVPIGVPGEIYLGGTAVARGYAGRAALTAERFVPDPFSGTPGARLYRTGDLARYRAEGAIEFLGRIDHQVKIRGFRVETGEVEAVLAEHPAVRCAAAVACEGYGDGSKRLIAYVVLERGATPSDRDLRRFLQDRLPAHMIPAAFVQLDALPLSANGKVDRRALPAPDARRWGTDRALVAARNSIEAAIAAIWREVLRLDAVSVHDSFFDLGGHSLLATQVASRIRDALGVDVPLRRLFEPPSSIADLAIAVVQCRAEQNDEAEVARLIDEIEQTAER